MTNFQAVYCKPVLSLMLMLIVAAGTGFAQSPSNTGKFWHVTDFHYDHTYWSSQLSCNSEVPQQPQFGDYWCDSPWRLVTSAIDAMATHSDVDFIIWTGDTVAHISDDNLTLDINMDILQNLTTALQQAFPNTKVYASYGNHDYYPSNQFPAMNNIIYNRTAEMWKQWIENPEQLDNFRKGGYYSLALSDTLRLVALNTNLYYTSDKQTVNITDPSDQLSWLSALLQESRASNQKVIVTAHIPPGVHTPSRVVWFQEKFNKAFIATLKNFTDVIVAMHFGHDHHDGFKVFHDHQGKATVPVFVAPSVTPWRYKLESGAVGPPHNPSVRLVTYEKSSGRHLNIEQLHLNLPEANSKGTANFTRLYSFTEHYKVSDLSASSLDKLITRMGSASEGDKLLGDYFWFATAGADQGERKCDKECKAGLLCGMTNYDYPSFDACVDNITSSASGLLPTFAALAMIVVMAVINCWTV